MVVSALKGTELLSDLTETLTPSRGAAVSSKTLPLKVVFSTTEISLVAAGKGVVVAEGAAEGAAVGAAEALAAAEGVAEGATEGLAETAAEGVALGATEGLAEGGVLAVGFDVVGAGPQATSKERVAATAKPVLRWVFFII